MSSNSLSRSFAASDASRVVAALAVCAALVVPVPLLAQHAPEPIMPAHAIQRVMPIPDEVHEERYTKRGAVIGGLIGAAGGLAFGTLLGLLCEAEGDGCWAAVPLIGGAGAAGGALVGGILGATVPRADERPREPADTARTDGRTLPAPAHRTGSFGITAGYAAADLAAVAEASGPAVRATLLAEVRPWLAIGLEAGQSFLGDEGDVRHAAVAFRGTWPLGRVSPYLNCNLGYYDMTPPSLEFFGGSLGVGARVLPDVRGRWFIDVEARRSRNLQNIEPLRMNALLAGVGLYW